VGDAGWGGEGEGRRWEFVEGSWDGRLSRAFGEYFIDAS
jgi:hypothetical protein